MPDEQAIVIAARVLNQPMDSFLNEALASTVEGLEPHYAPAHFAGRLQFDNEQHRVRIMSTVDLSLAVQPLIDAIESGQLAADDVGTLSAPVIERAEGEQLTDVWTAFTDVDQNGRLAPEVIVSVLSAFEKAALARGEKPQAGLGSRNIKKLVRFSDHPDRGVQLAASRLALIWNIRGVSPNMQLIRQALRDDNRAIVDRVNLATFLGSLNPRVYEGIANSMLQDAEATPAIKHLGVLMYAVARRDAAPPLAAEVFSEEPQHGDPRYLVEVFIRQRGGAELLGLALEQTEPHPKTAQLILQFLNEVGEQNEKLVSAVTPRSDTPLLTEQLLDVDVNALIEDIATGGNSANGRVVFARESLTCARCHRFNQEDVLVGPDLGQIGRSPVDYLIESVLQPSSKIKEQFVNVGVYTVDGKVITGILQYRDDEKITVRSGVDGSEVTILADEIDEIADLQSLMPSGLVDPLTRQEFLDLMKFLTECK